MKRKVSYSKFSILLTVGTTLLIGGFGVYFLAMGNVEKGWVLLGILGVLILASLLYAPLYVEADEYYVVVSRPLRKKRIPMSEIVGVTYSPPTMAQKRSCASGGFMGYWGWFHERPEGNYFGYYGRSSDTFLLILANDRRYMLGCDNSHDMAHYIRGHIPSARR